MSKYAALHLIIWLLLGIIVGSSSCRKSQYLIEEEEIYLSDDGTGVGNVTWTSGKTYILEGFVFVNDGQVLTIEPGVVVKARTGQGENASALIIARGGKIYAEGTRENPIIFTVDGDDLKGSVPLEARGLWGGVMVLGNAPVHTESGEARIEGIPYYEPRGIFGGYQEDDDSGILKYLSIRHGGTNIGEGNEINGLTLAGVGNQTVVDYVEVISNEDDGIEIFGGTVNIKHTVVAFCGDDAYDYDLGYSGKGQFLLGIQKAGLGDRLFENGGNVVIGEETSHPVFFNLTLIGQGSNSNKPTMSFLENAGGKFYNSLMLEQQTGVELQKIADTENSYQQFLDGNVRIEECWFYDIASNQADQVFVMSGGYTTQDLDNWSSYFHRAGNQIRNTGIGLDGGKYNLLPISIEWDSQKEYTDNFFDPVVFKGAFGTVNWANGWTLLDEMGLIEN